MPVALMFNQNISPHEFYADQIISLTNEQDVILLGHERAWLLGKREVYSYMENYEINKSKNYFMTMHHITSENRYDLQLLFKFIGKNPIDLEIVRNNYLVNYLCDCYFYERKIYFEDPYLYFTSTNPSIFERILFESKKIEIPEFWICRVCLNINN
ncbi:MAG: hypothetical protein QXY79_01895 [Candidatus Methanomethylicia archaeon]